MTKADLELMFQDLPDADIPGRAGLPCRAAKVARVCFLASNSLLARQPSHLKEELGAARVKHMRATYRYMPDTYYGNNEG